MIIWNCFCASIKPHILYPIELQLCHCTKGIINATLEALCIVSVYGTHDSLGATGIIAITFKHQLNFERDGIGWIGINLCSRYVMYKNQT